MKQVVAALILRGDEVLICQRTKHQPMPLQWEFPGGKVEPDENAVDALARELDEELGIKAEIGREVATIRHTYKNGGELELHFFVVDRYTREIENRIFKDVRWEKLSKLPQYNFLEADLGLVRDIAAGKVL